MNNALFRRRSRIASNRARFYRPLVESLESRDLLAFNLTISTAATANVSTDNTVQGTRTFKATDTGANLSLADMDGAFSAGLNVVVSSGSGGTILPPFEAGSISTSGITTHVFNNATNKTLTISSGTGTGSQLSSIILSGLQLANAGSLIIDANLNVSLSNTLIATTISVTAGIGSVTMPSGGLLQAKDLTLIAGAAIGTSTKPVLTSVGELTTDTSANNTDQFITEASGLGAIELDAGSGDITLTVTAGAVTDTDAATDMVAASATVVLQDATSQDFGSSAPNQIATSVNDLSVSTSSGGGNQSIIEADGITQLSLNAGSGGILLTVQTGAVADTDTTADLVGLTAIINLKDATAKNFGASAKPINTSVNTLLVNTFAGDGDQFITEENGLTFLHLNAGTGDVTLKVTMGSVFGGQVIDITADVASIELDDATAKNFGSAFDPIGTSVNSLSVSTFAGGGSQFIAEFNGLDGLQLNASAGNVTLTVLDGAVADTDPSTDIFAAAATVTVNVIGFGAAANPIRTSVDSLSVDTSLGSGDQFITEDNGLTGLNLNAGAGNLQLGVAQGDVTDNDSDVDIEGARINTTLDNASPKDFGSADHPIGTSVDGLFVDTTAGDGNQFIVETNGLTALGITADAGNITLTVTAGAIVDTDAAEDIKGAAASVTLSGAGDFGTLTKSIRTSVSTLVVNTAAGNGNQFITEADSTILTSDAGTGSITLVGGTFNLATTFFPGALGDSSTLIVNSPAIVNLDREETVGGLAGNGTVTSKDDGRSEALSVGDNNADTTFSGTLTGVGVPADTFIKQGSGTLTLSGTHTFTGRYKVESGKLLVTGTFASSPVGALVSAANLSSVLGGTGTINRGVLISNGAHLAPGVTTGVLNTGDLTFDTVNLAPEFDVEITSAAAGGFDQVNVTGTVVIETTGAGVELNVAKVGTVNLTNGDKLAIINNDGTSDAVQGTFKDLPEGAVLSSNFLGTGLAAKISYKGISGNDNDVVLLLSPGSLFPWHNDDEPLDAVGSGTITPDDHIVAGDALAVINYINSFGAGPVPANAVIGEPFGFIDTTGGPNGGGDNNVAPSDALEIINAINAGQGGEGEAATSSVFGVQGSGDSGQSVSGSASNNDNLLTLLALDTATQSIRRRRS